MNETAADSANGAGMIAKKSTDAPPAPPDEPAEEDASHLRKALRAYSLAMRAHRSFLHLLHQTLEEHEKEHRAFLERLTAELQEHDAALQQLRRQEDQLPPAEGAENRPHERPRDPDSQPELRKAARAITARVVGLGRELLQRMPSTAHKRLLYRSVLIGLVAEFEVLIANLAHAFFRRAPRALPAAEHHLTLQELIDVGTIDDAIQYVISREVDGLLRESVLTWQKFFASRVKLDLSDFAPDWPRFCEYFQRRHIVVHAGGKITRRYLEHVNAELLSEYFDDATPGNTAPLDEEYTRACLDAFEATGLCFGFGVWEKLHSDEKEAQERDLTHLLYDQVKRGVWPVAAYFAAWGRDCDCYSRGTRLVCRFNYWLATKRVAGLDAVVEDVSTFDASGLSAQYQLARLALLERSDDFFALLESERGAGLDQEAWDEWPIFDEMRQEDRFNDLRSRFLEKRLVADEEVVQSAD